MLAVVLLIFNLFTFVCNVVLLVLYIQVNKIENVSLQSVPAMYVTLSEIFVGIFYATVGIAVNFNADMFNHNDTMCKLGKHHFDNLLSDLYSRFLSN